MGMFDWIDYEGECPKCGAEVKDFQSKDGPCNLIRLKPWEVYRFYAMCRNCRSWLEYVRKESAGDPAKREAPPEPENWESMYLGLSKKKDKHDNSL